MKTIKLLLAIVTATTLNLKFGTLNCKAQTSVPAGNVSGTWTLAGSPYNIQGSVQIANGTTLTIQPGVTVNFQGTYKLNVKGRLLAIGTAIDTIIFTAANTSDGWRGIDFNNTLGTNDTSKIVYCKLQYGKATGVSGLDEDGGALFFNGFSKAILSNSNISNCYSSSRGGGIYCYAGSSPVFNNNTISNNIAGGGGAGIYCDGSNSIINNCTISNNLSSGEGGGIQIVGGNNTISNNIISNNSAYNGGGIMAGSTSSFLISNNTISNNSANGNGGGFYFNGSSPIITNNTIVNNNAGNGGALYCTFASPTLQNSSLWGNTSSAGAQVFITNQSNPNFYYCDVQGGLIDFELNGNSYMGTYSNNINTDPLFVSPSGGSGTGFNGVIANWALQSNSPCINTGDPSTNTPSFDILGNPRITNCYIDMGAYENQAGTIFTLTIVQTAAILCFGNTTGALHALAAGSGSSYTYLWSNGQTTATVTDLIAGSYSVIVSETGIACSITETFTINQPAYGFSLTPLTTDASCNSNDGSASIIEDTASYSYSFLWSNGSTNQNLTAIGSGTYSVTVTDSNSCAISETLIVNTLAPSSIPICMVTVDSSSTKNVIVWEKPIGAQIDSFRIYREVASVFTHVGSVHYEDVSEFFDNTNGINPNTTSYKYKMSVLDSCGTESPLSDVHQTVHVQLSLAFPQGVNLSWNNYAGFSFSQYRILRDDLGNGNWQAIDSVSFGTTTYTSPDVLPNAGYIVEATRPTACVSTRQSGTTRNSSKSNTALKQTIGVNELLNDLALIISPNPSNGKFLIELSSPGFSNNNKFALKIYNVLGEQIYLSELKQLTRNEIDLSTVPKGIYFVNVYNGNKIYTRKIVKQ